MLEAVDGPGIETWRLTGPRKTSHGKFRSAALVGIAVVFRGGGVWLFLNVRVLPLFRDQILEMEQ